MTRSQAKMNSKVNPPQKADIPMVGCVEGPPHAKEKPSEMEIDLDDTTLIPDSDSKSQEVLRLLHVVDSGTIDPKASQVSYTVFQGDKEIPKVVASAELPGLCVQMNDVHLRVLPVSYILFDSTSQHPQQLQNPVDIQKACDAINSEHSGIYEHQLLHLDQVCQGKRSISTWLECTQQSGPWYPRSQ